MNLSPAANSRPVPRFSTWAMLSILFAFVAFTVSTLSPLGVLLFGGLMLSLVVRERMARDSANIWGLRLLVYAGAAVLGRAVTAGPLYRFDVYDSRAFVTPGIILGGEIILQLFREPPRGLRFDPVIVLLTGLLFLIACNTVYRADLIFVVAPIYIFCTLLALRDARLDMPKPTLRTNLQRFVFLGIACVLGLSLHLELRSHSATIMALGARLLSSSRGVVQGEGISDTPQLTSTFGPNNTTTRIMRISGSLSSQHLRAAAFDIYRNGTWGPSISSRTSQLDSPLPQVTRENDPKDPSQYRSDTDATITVLSPIGGYLYVPLNIYALVPSSGISLDWKRYDGPVKTEENPPFSYAVINAKASEDKYGFEATQGPMCLPPSTTIKVSNSKDALTQSQQLLEVPPEIDPRVRQLALRITEGSRTPLTKVSRVVDYLFKNHKYSYEFTRTSQDPVSDFLLNKKSGHCQYFASAATILLRCAGVPARYVTGFYAHEVEPSGTTVVRGRDAHAWTEVYIDKLGWVSIDATVPSGRADESAHPLPTYQKALEWVQDAFGRVRDWFGRLTTLQIAEIMGVVLVIWSLERWRQSRKKRRALPQGLPLPEELAPLAQRFERVLARRGIVLAAEQPWSEALAPELEAETRWVELYNRIRFSQSGGDRLDELRQELQVLEQTKASATRPDGVSPPEASSANDTTPNQNAPRPPDN